MPWRRALLGGALAAFMSAIVVLLWPAVAHADFSFLPYPGDISPFTWNGWFYGSLYAFVAIVVISGIVWLIRSARSNRSDSTDRPTRDGRR